MRKHGAILGLAAAVLIALLGANLVLAEARERSGELPEADSVTRMTLEEVRAAYPEDTAFTVFALSCNSSWSMRGTAYAKEDGESVWHAEPEDDWSWNAAGAFGYEEPYPLGAVWVAFPDGRTALAVMNVNAHGEDAVEGNDFDGQMDIHFADSERAGETYEAGWAQTGQMARIAWHDQTPMTAQEMAAVYADSTRRMNTIASYRYDEGFLEAYEAEVRAKGETLKEDMVICDLPGEDDMPYDAALEFAYALIEQTYRTPRSELLQMGVYPTFYTYPYLAMEPEWEFYITPRRNCDIHSDHMYPAAGEYRVQFTARTQRVGLCLWYLEERPEGEMRWSERYSMALNPVLPEEEISFEAEPIDETSQEAQRAFEIVRQDAMAYLGIDGETYAAVFMENLHHWEQDVASVSLLVRKSAPEAWKGHNYSYAVNVQTGEVVNRQVTMATISALPREGSAVLDYLGEARTQENIDAVQPIGLRRSGEHAQAEVVDALWDGHALSLGVTLAAQRNAFMVVDDVRVDGERLEATSGNMEDMWLYGLPSRAQGGGMALGLSGEIEGTKEAGSISKVDLAVTLLVPKGETVEIDTHREDWHKTLQAIRACAAEGNTPVEADEPHGVLAPFGDGLALGDAQFYAREANMEALETFEFAFELIAP